jgi:hypothetical protein
MLNEMVLVLDAVFSSTSTSTANAEYEYEKPGHNTDLEPERLEIAQLQNERCGMG